MLGCFLGNSFAWQACKLCLSDRWWEEKRIECYYCHVILCCFWIVNSKGKAGRLPLGSQKTVSSGSHDVAGFLMQWKQSNGICLWKSNALSQMITRHNSALKPSEVFWSAAGIFVVSIWEWHRSKRVTHFLTKAPHASQDICNERSEE